MIQCCHNCPDRWIDTEKGVTCHSTCDEYAKEVKRSEEIRKKKQLDLQWFSYVRNRHNRR
jgi:hypothetical protein